MEQDVNMELEMQQSADPVVPTVRTTRPVQKQHIVEPESLEQPVQITGIPEPHPSSIRTPQSPQLIAHRQSGPESQDTFQTSPEVVPVSKLSHFPSVPDTTEGSLNEQDVNIKNLMSFFQQAVMYLETCQWVLAKISNLQLGKQKLEQANKTLKELQAQVKSNQVQEDFWLRNHEFNKLSIELESLWKDFTDLQTKYWDDRKDSNHLMVQKEGLEHDYRKVQKTLLDQWVMIKNLEANQDKMNQRYYDLKNQFNLLTAQNQRRDERLQRQKEGLQR